MNNDLISPEHSPLLLAGHVADYHAAQNVFREYQERRAKNTLRRQKDDLRLFTVYLASAGVVLDAQNLYESPEAWQDITHGLVEGFVRWMVREGYAIGSVNVRLATIKVYTRLSVKAEYLSPDEYSRITLVKGYQHKERRNIDTTRTVTRRGTKKARPVALTQEQATFLKTQPETPQGYRDSLLMCLLLDHGLRCGEIAALTPETLNTSTGLLSFYRQKVDKDQIHMLTRDTLLAAIRYLEVCQPQRYLLMGSRKSRNGEKLGGTMMERAITERVKVLGEAIGVQGLSAHDCRHYWVESAIRGQTHIRNLQDAGGWSNPVIPLRYAESQKIANAGVNLA